MFCFLIYFVFFCALFSTFGLPFVASSLFAPVVVAVAVLVAVVVVGFVSYIVHRVCVRFVSFCSVCCVSFRFVLFACCVFFVIVVVVVFVFCSSISFCSEFWADFYFSVAAPASAPDLDLRTAGTDGSEGQRTCRCSSMRHERRAGEGNKERTR